MKESGIDIPYWPTDELPPRMSTGFPLAVGPLSGKATPVFWKSPMTAVIEPRGRVDAWSSLMLSGIFEMISLSTRAYC